MLSGVQNANGDRFPAPVGADVSRETALPEQMAIVRSKHRLGSMEEDSSGVEIERIPENDPSIVGATAVVIWSESMVTYTYVRRQGRPEMNRIFQFNENTTRFYPPGHDLKVLVEDQAMWQNWEQTRAALHGGFAGVSPDEWERWPMITQLMSEGRHVDLKIGTKEDQPRF
jgi:hypothetical protein